MDESPHAAGEGDQQPPRSHPPLHEERENGERDEREQEPPKVQIRGVKDRNHGDDRHGCAARIREVAGHELALQLESGDEEEDRKQTVGCPCAEGEIEVEC